MFAKKKKNRIISIVAILLILSSFFLFISTDAVEFFGPKFYDATKVFLEDNNNRINQSRLLFLFILLTLILAFFTKNKVSQTYLVISIISFISLFLFSIAFVLIISSLGYFFVLSRVMTSIQLLFVLYSGVAVVLILHKIIVPKIIPSVTMIMLISSIVFNFNHLEEYKKITFAGSGLSPIGYSFERLFHNEYLTPQIYVAIGNYFETLPDGKYKIVGPHKMRYEDEWLRFNPGMNTISNKIEVINSQYSKNPTFEVDEILNINRFLNSELEYREDFFKSISKHKVDYVITEKKEVANILIERGYSIAFEFSHPVSEQKIVLFEITKNR